MSLHCKENENPPPGQWEPSQAAASAPSSSAGSDRQPPGLPPSSSTTQACNDGGSIFFVREALLATVEVEEPPPSAMSTSPSRTCFICGVPVLAILSPCDHCNAPICLEHTRSCGNELCRAPIVIFTEPSKRRRSTRYECDGSFCPNHELLHNCPAPVGDIVDDGDDPGSSDKDSFAKADTGNLPAAANS